MSTDHDDRHGADGRLLDLLADKALFGLDAAEERECADLLASGSVADREQFDRLAAETAVALAGVHGAMPVELRARLRGDARRFAAGEAVVPGRHAWLPVELRGGLMLLGTVAAAACVLFMVAGPGRDKDSAPDPEPVIAQDPPQVAPRVPEVPPTRLPTPALQRDEMLASVRDAQTIDCVAAAGSDEQADADGDVVWSDQRRRGFLRVKGLARSKPGRNQYRIWILDGSRGKPISGGVFHVAEDVGEVVVPILPQAPVQGPTMFVVTAEEPGGDGEYDAGRARVVARAE
jgi:hypothetical protein